MIHLPRYPATNSERLQLLTIDQQRSKSNNVRTDRAYVLCVCIIWRNNKVYTYYTYNVYYVHILYNILSNIWYFYKNFDGHICSWYTVYCASSCNLRTRSINQYRRLFRIIVSYRWTTIRKQTTILNLLNVFTTKSVYIVQVWCIKAKENCTARLRDVILFSRCTAEKDVKFCFVTT